jgi:gliding motility-associated-like protein
MMKPTNCLRHLWCVALLLLHVGDVWAQYQANGAAASTSCNCYRLTPAQNGQNGSVWNVNLIDLSQPFDFSFDVFLGCSNGGADGMAFVLQPLSVNAGSAGGGIGYQGINPSVAVEMDTYQNATDPSFNHMAIQTNGVVTHGGANTLAGPVQISATTQNVTDCQWHLFQVSWNPATNTLTTWFDGVQRLQVSSDIINNFFGGNPMVYWGFTAATGGANNLHQFCNALQPEFTIDAATPCVGSPIQFSSTSIVATGLITSYAWNLGDGTTSTEPTPEHTYAAPGTYNVTLTITSEGCTASETATVTVNGAPTVSLGPDVSICVGDGVQITPTGAPANSTFSWTPATSVSNPSIANPMFTPTVTTEYTLTVTDANGCSGSDDILITVNPLPIASAGADVATCIGEPVTLTATGGVSYAWGPAGGLTAPNAATTQANPAATTTYGVLVTDANGCQAVDDVTVTVNPLPAVTANAAQPAICAGQTVQLVGGGAVAYEWTPATGLSNPNTAITTLTGSSTQTFVLNGTDVNGCENTAEVTVTVNPLPQAVINPIPDGCLGNASTISQSSTGDGLNYSWTLGDNTSSTAAFVSHSYTSVGTYDVTLTVTDANGCQDTDDAVATVVDLPNVSMTISGAPDFCVGEPINLQNTSTSQLEAVLWNFAFQPGLPTQPFYSSSQQNPQFTYPVQGTYTVRLLGLAASGCTNDVTQTVNVHAIPQADFDFTLVCEGEATGFNSLSTVEGNTVVTGWQWTFGDGSPIDYPQNPVHVYGQSGTYSVELIVQTNQGCRDTVMKDVWVHQRPVVSISANEVCHGDETLFTNSTVPDDETIVSWTWLFGNGQGANTQDASLTYTNPGVFNVSLTAATDSGCTATGTTTVRVNPNPQPAFAVVNREGCEPHTAQFVNSSIIASGSIASYAWEFGDGNIGGLPSMPHTYEGVIGDFDVTLTTVSNAGCETAVTVADAVTVLVTPVADFMQSATSISVIEPKVEFTNMSVDALTYQWSFGNGTFSSLQSPVAVYPDSGEFVVELIAVNGICRDTATSMVKVEPVYTFFIPNAFRPNSSGRNDYFFPKGEAFVNYRMFIYDRWGMTLYEGSEGDIGWDGSFKGKQVPNGVYVYRIIAQDWSGEERVYNGSVALIR